MRNRPRHVATYPLCSSSSGPNESQFAEMMVHRYDGDRDLLRPLFGEADDSEQQIDTYLGLGAVFVAEDDGEIIGHVHRVWLSQDL